MAPSRGFHFDPHLLFTSFVDSIESTRLTPHVSTSITYVLFYFCLFTVTHEGISLI